jgi:glycosyltransferase involved in cell wall biosynthesis
MEPAITIIIPIYNGAKYLARCLDSITAQTFGIDNLRLLLLNDGSTDDSLKIAETYAKKFPSSIKVFSHKNMGAAKTRNKGLSLVETRYTMFVDQDDFIDRDYCQKFYEAADTSDADVVAGGFRRTNGEKVFYTRPANRSTWYPFVHMETWAKIHKTEFIKKTGAQFFDNVFGEDIPFSVQEILSNPRYAVIDYVGYNWFVNDDSLTKTVHRDFSKLNLAKLLDKLGDLSNSELAEYHILVVALYGFMVGNVNSNRQEFQQNLKEIFREIVKVAPNFDDNKFIKNRVDGCPLGTYLVVRIFVSFYKKAWYDLLYILYLAQRRKVNRK